MKYDITPYPCDIKIGDKMQTKDGRIREIESIDGRFIRFSDGSTFGLLHPDLIGVAVEKKKKKKTVEEE